MHDAAEDDLPLPKAMSKKIFGFGIVTSGLVILAFGLVIGLQFPKHVFRNHLADVCVNASTHPHFTQWVSVLTS